MSASSFRYKKVDMNYARVAAALVVLLPSSAFLARLYKDMNAECAFLFRIYISFLTANQRFFFHLPSSIAQRPDGRSQQTEPRTAKAAEMKTNNAKIHS